MWEKTVRHERPIEQKHSCKTVVDYTFTFDRIRCRFHWVHRQIQFRALHHHIAHPHLLANSIITLPVSLMSIIITFPALIYWKIFFHPTVIFRLRWSTGTTSFISLHNNITPTYFIVTSTTTHLLATSPLFVVSISGNFYIFRVFSQISYLCQYDYVCILFSHVSILCCVFVLVSWCMCICIYTHGGLPYFPTFTEWKRYQCCHPGGERNRDPLFDSVTAVSTDIERNYFFFMYFYIYPEELLLFYSQ